MKPLLAILLLGSSLLATDLKYKLGEEIYQATCTSCHGDDGKAQTDVRFIVSPRDLSKTILTQEQSYQIIKKGTHYWGSAADIMPSFESVLNEKELRSIAYYISTKFNPDIEQKIEKLYAQSDVIPESKKHKMPKRGKKIYKRNCSWCHGVTAQGDGAATRNPEMSIFPYDLSKTLLSKEQMFLYVKDGGKHWGTHQEDMPGWAKKYDDFTIKSVVKYIQTNFRNNDVK